MSKDQNFPAVTVIMPVRNEGDFMRRSLGAVLAQDYPHAKMEIFVADGMSDDNSREIMAELAKSSDIPIQVIDNPKKIVPTGFNLAMQKASGEIIVRVDGHCEIAPDYVRQCVLHLKDESIAGVGGPIETISLDETGETIAVAMSSKFGVGGSAFRTVKDKALLVDTIAFPAYKRSVMDEAGLLDEEMMRNQDDEYNYRLRSMGHKLLLSPDVKSRYYSRSSLTKLWKQYYQYGFYKVRVMQKHPQQMSIRQFAPPLFVASLLLGAILAPFSSVILALWLGLIGLYLVANLVASVLTARQEGWKHLILLPLVFAILHLSYGFGFLHGLVAFAKHWVKR
jgi:succinoglycan biosynthesis protein ExoA